MKKRSRKELRVYCRELDALFALSDERNIRDALFALVPNLRRVVDTLVQSLPISGSRLSWQPDLVRKGANGPTEEWELSCRADAATGDTLATISALISFYNPYMGGGFRLDARIYGGRAAMPTCSGQRPTRQTIRAPRFGFDSRPLSQPVRSLPPLGPRSQASSHLHAKGERGRPGSRSAGSALDDPDTSRTFGGKIERIDAAACAVTAMTARGVRTVLVHTAAAVVCGGLRPNGP